MKFKKAFWGWVHNCVAHWMEGWWILFTLGKSTPNWLDAFHDWTAEKMWGLR